jgi:predicted transcriptional regulator
MHFNVYIDDATGQQLNQTAELVGESRNALIRKAVREWLERQGEPQWPAEVLGFEGMAVMPPFEANRSRLSPPLDDPLA